MPVTQEEVRRLLEPEEPDYARAAQLGPEALPHLDALIASNDPGIASKAASLAGMIGGQQAAVVLDKAARHDDPRVRVAAAGAARHLDPGPASQVLSVLINDADVGVQKMALRAAPAAPSSSLRAAMRNLSVRGTNSAISQLAQEMLSRALPEAEASRGLEAAGAEPGAGPTGEMPAGNMNETTPSGTAPEATSRAAPETEGGAAPFSAAEEGSRAAPADQESWAGPTGEMPTGDMNAAGTGPASPSHNSLPG